MLANSMINRGGPGFVARIAGDGGDVADIAAALAVARDSFDFLDMFREIDALDTALPAVSRTASISIFSASAECDRVVPAP